MIRIKKYFSNYCRRKHSSIQNGGGGGGDKWWHDSTLYELEYKNELRIEEERKNAELEKQEKYKRSFKRVFKETTIRTGIKSSFPCFPSIFEPKRFHLTKFIWILIAMCSTAYWIYQTVIIYQLYASYQIVSSYSLQTETKPIFPGKYNK
jgi:hypothetical protein